VTTNLAVAVGLHRYFGLHSNTGGVLVWLSCHVSSSSSVYGWPMAAMRGWVMLFLFFDLWGAWCVREFSSGEFVDLGR
jgi:hypothetical protein